ncbi:MAG TPA: hypothetical protein PKH33_17270, partial [bacterium]|nr:hypothetical protein [bacterium]
MVSDYGPRANNGYDFHAGIDYSAAAGDTDAGTPIPAVESGRISSVGRRGNFRSIGIDGSGTGDEWHYLHLFRDCKTVTICDVVPERGNTSVEWVYKASVSFVDPVTGNARGNGNVIIRRNASTQKALVVYCEYGFDGSWISINNQYVKNENGNNATCSGTVTAGDFVGPMGDSGGDYDVHLHLGLNYRWRTAPNAPTFDNPLYHLRYNDPSYVVRISEPNSKTQPFVVYHQRPIKTEAVIASVEQKAKSGFDLNKVGVYLKRKGEATAEIINESRTETPPYQMLIDFGGRPLGYDEHFPSGNMPNNNLRKDRPSSSFYSTSEYTGVVPGGFISENIAVTDTFHFRDFNSKIRHDYNDNAGLNSKAKYKDGEYTLTVKATNVKDRYTGEASVDIIIDNFAPYVEKVEVKRGAATIYDAEWEPMWPLMKLKFNNNANGTVSLSDGEVLPLSTMSFVVTFSETIKDTHNNKSPTLAIRRYGASSYIHSRLLKKSGSSEMWTISFEDNQADKLHQGIYEIIILDAFDMAGNPLDTKPFSIATRGDDGKWNDNYNSFIYNYEKSDCGDTNHRIKVQYPAPVMKEMNLYGFKHHPAYVDSERPRVLLGFGDKKFTDDETKDLDSVYYYSKINEEYRYIKSITNGLIHFNDNGMVLLFPNHTDISAPITINTGVTPYVFVYKYLPKTSVTRKEQYCINNHISDWTPDEFIIKSGDILAYNEPSDEMKYNITSISAYELKNGETIDDIIERLDDANERNKAAVNPSRLIQRSGHAANIMDWDYPRNNPVVEKVCLVNIRTAELEETRCRTKDNADQAIEITLNNDWEVYAIATDPSNSGWDNDDFPNGKVAPGIFRIKYDLIDANERVLLSAGFELFKSLLNDTSWYGKVISKWDKDNGPNWYAVSRAMPKYGATISESEYTGIGYHQFIDGIDVNTWNPFIVESGGLYNLKVTVVDPGDLEDSMTIPIRIVRANARPKMPAEVYASRILHNTARIGWRIFSNFGMPLDEDGNTIDNYSFVGYNIYRKRVGTDEEYIKLTNEPIRDLEMFEESYYFDDQTADANNSYEYTITLVRSGWIYGSYFQVESDKYSENWNGRIVGAVSPTQPSMPIQKLWNLVGISANYQKTPGSNYYFGAELVLNTLKDKGIFRMETCEKDGNRFQNMGTWSPDTGYTAAFNNQCAIETAKPGLAFMVYNPPENQISAMPIYGEANSASNIFRIELDSGWNMVANPYQIELDWGKVHVLKGTSEKSLSEAMSSGWVDAPYKLVLQEEMITATSDMEFSEAGEVYYGLIVNESVTPLSGIEYRIVNCPTGFSDCKNVSKWVALKAGENVIKAPSHGNSAGIAFQNEAAALSDIEIRAVDDEQGISLWAAMDSEGWISKEIKKYTLSWGLHQETEAWQPWKGYLLKANQEGLKLVFKPSGATTVVDIGLSRESAALASVSPQQQPPITMAARTNIGENNISLDSQASESNRIFDVVLYAEADGFWGGTFTIDYDDKVLAPYNRETGEVYTLGETIPLEGAQGLLTWTAKVGNSIDVEQSSLTNYSGRTPLGTITFIVLPEAFGKSTNIDFKTGDDGFRVFGEIDGFGVDYEASSDHLTFIEKHFVDYTPPKIKITEVTPEAPRTWIKPGATGGTPGAVTVKFKFTDNYYDTGDVVLAVTMSGGGLVAGTRTEFEGVAAGEEMTFTWDGTVYGAPAADGLYFMEISATDPRLNTAYERVAVTVDTAKPTISHPTPEPGKDAGSLTPVIHARVVDNANGVGIDGRVCGAGQAPGQDCGLLMEVDGAAVEAVWDAGAKLFSAPAGTTLTSVNNHTVRVAARDNLGNEAEYEWSFTIDSAAPSAPELTFTSDSVLPSLEQMMGIEVPRDGKRYVSGSVGVTATAKDGEASGIAGIKKQEIYVNGGLAKSQTYYPAATTATGMLIWNTLAEEPVGTRKYPDGEHVIEAVAYDVIGNKSATASVAVFVDNM